MCFLILLVSKEPPLSPSFTLDLAGGDGLKSCEAAASFSHGMSWEAAAFRDEIDQNLPNGLQIQIGTICSIHGYILFAGSIANGLL